jgi:hypothetical protein
VIRIRDLSRSIEDTVLRIGRIEAGTLLNGVITITALNDVFALPLASFKEQQPGIDQETFTPKVTKARVFEVPYVTLARYTTQADFAYIPDDAGYVGMVAKPPDLVHGGFEAGVKDGLPTLDEFPEALHRG